ncbi:N-acetyltransferase [Brevibacterium sp. JNUCC-42]|nr:N-acetyltransferase [Brevibacterium sp. JNUCC-42]
MSHQINESVFIHPTAEVSKQACIGAGTKIWNNAQVREQSNIGSQCIISKDVYIDQGVKIGNNVKIQNGVSVYHGVEIDDNVFLGPHMTFTNDLFPRAFTNAWKVVPTKVEMGASIGAHATIVCGTTIGAYSMVGAGSVVIHNVGAHQLVVGNPARMIGLVCYCGERIEHRKSCHACGQSIPEDVLL